MDFADATALYVGPRVRAGERGWSAVLRADFEEVTESQLEPVRSYEEAESLMNSVGADRLFIPADVLADMAAEGVGP